ncbi:glycerophosphodiester phosphodiesterase family protein [Labrenzia sp. 011]|uniref:glycerophosphodiester phosphodiesterase family protein n=1 Tax=Labrenzia sp. 011 TaxID=2171494 RepID=UPI000D50A129|nr:glycerophosphodiester phosphodiesterase family protein [Labrenzia sp. 011]PVB63291.1 glycerophosphodiester phosphodiesterase [Labrenzia sp. 011]
MRSALAALSLTGLTLACPAQAEHIELGPRPAYLVSQMPAGPLKEKLAACIGQPAKRTLFSVSHRGAPLQFPEHTEEGYRAASLMGAGILECDVTFTKDKELVCRHSQNDLHTTTNILATDLAETCTQGFTPASGDAPASAECRTSDITLAEFKSLRGKMDAADKTASTVDAYMSATAPWRTDLYAGTGTLLSHRESIELFRDLGVKFMPELKGPAVDMPFDGLTREAYAQKLIEDYKAAGIPPEDVYPQSFDLDDVRYWISHEPEFGRQAVYLDGRRGLDPMDPGTFSPSMAELKAMGLNYIAPPLFMLLTLEDGRIVPSAYAKAARDAGLEIVTWSLERSGPLNGGGGWYYQSVSDAIDGDGRMLEVVDVLARDVGVKGIFSDWPATTSFYASCMGLE